MDEIATSKDSNQSRVIGYCWYCRSDRESKCRNLASSSRSIAASIARMFTRSHLSRQIRLELLQFHLEKLCRVRLDANVIARSLVVAKESMPQVALELSSFARLRHLVA